MNNTREEQPPEVEVFFDCFPYEWRLGTSDGLFLPINPHRSMRVVLGFDDL